jgi:uncharacterized coiled-coil protein SlyX
MPTTFNPFMPFHPKADSQVILSRECFERGCAAHNHMTDGPGVVFEDWEAIAADQAMTIAMLKADLDKWKETAHIGATRLAEYMKAPNDPTRQLVMEHEKRMLWQANRIGELETTVSEQAMTIAILKSELNLVYEVAAQICEKYAKANEENDNMVAAFIQAAEELRTKKDFPVLTKLLRGE